MGEVEEEISMIIIKKKIIQMIILKYLRMLLKVYLLKVLIIKLYKVTEEDLKDTFNNFWQIASCKILKDKET